MKSRGTPGLWFLWSRKYSEVVRIRRHGQRQPNELHVRLHLLHRSNHGVVETSVGLGVDVVLEFNLVQYFPVRNWVVVARLVVLAKLIGEAAARVPGKQASIVIGNLLHAGIAQLSAFFVVPRNLVRVRRIRPGLVGLVHPLRNRAEVENG
jgi:hypothetical protein